MNSEVLWYYIEKDQQIGPVTESEMITLIRSGRLKRDAYVWKDGMADWAEAYMSELGQYFRAEAPTGDSAGETFEDAAARVRDFVSPGGELKKKLSWWFHAFWISELSGFLFSMTGGWVLLTSIASILFSMLIIYNGWKLMEKRPFNLSPLVIVLLEFIPLFNIYWNFVCFYGLTQELNRELERRQISDTRVSEGLGLAYAIAAVLTSMGIMGSMMVHMPFFMIGAMGVAIVVFILQVLLLRSIIKGMKRLL